MAEKDVPSEADARAQRGRPSFRRRGGAYRGLGRTLSRAVDRVVRAMSVRRRGRVIEDDVRSVFNRSLDLLCILDLDRLTLLRINPAVERILGYDASELVGRPLRSLVHPEDATAGWPVFEASLRRAEMVTDFEIRCRCRDGSYRWLNWTCRPRSGSGTACAAGRDVTDRHEVEAALRESEERFRAVFENATLGLYRSTPDGRILMANRALVRMLGYTRFEELAVRNLEEDGFESQFPRSLFKRRVEAEGRITGLEAAWVRRDGATLRVRESARAVRDAAGRILYYEGSVEDVTQRWEAERRALDAQRRLRELASELTLTEERLKRTVATELHDRISQSLAIAQMSLASLQTAVDDPEVRNRLRRITAVLRQVLEESRSLTRQLSYPALGVLGLAKAVEQWLGEEVEAEGGLRTHFHDDAQDKPLDDDVRAVLFRGVREALANTVKHAAAQEVTVAIHRDGGHVVVTITDDGRGFDVSERLAQGRGFGLLSLLESLGRLGGEAGIESQPGAGCRVTLRAPLAVPEPLATQSR